MISMHAHNNKNNDSNNNNNNNNINYKKVFHDEKWSFLFAAVWPQVEFIFEVCVHLMLLPKFYHHGTFSCSVLDSSATGCC